MENDDKSHNVGEFDSVCSIYQSWMKKYIKKWSQLIKIIWKKIVVI